MTEAPDTGVAAAEAKRFRRKVLLRLAFGLATVMAVLAIVGTFVKEPVVALSRHYVDALGGVGVALGFFVPDTFPLPIWHDAFLAFGLLGGLPFFEVALWATGGSLAGGSIAYLLGRRLSGSKWYARRLLTRRWREAHDLIRRWGAWFLAFCAVSPLPYSIGCWSAGVVKMPARMFFLVSLLRFPRVLLYLTLVKLGAVSVFGV